LKNPRCQDIISIGFVVGGGGGHELHVEDLKLAVSRRTTGLATTPSGGYPPSSISAAPTPAAPPLAAVPPSNGSKEKMQAFLKNAIAELVASGMTPTEAAAKAIENAKKQQFQELIKKAFAELVATGLTPSEAAAKAIEQAKSQMTVQFPVFP